MSPRKFQIVGKKLQVFATAITDKITNELNSSESSRELEKNYKNCH